MFTIKKVNCIEKENTVRYSDLKNGEGFRHVCENYLCIKIPDGHMYDDEGHFGSGNCCRSNPKVIPVPVCYQWSDK